MATASIGFAVLKPYDAEICEDLLSGSTVPDPGDLVGRAASGTVVPAESGGTNWLGPCVAKRTDGDDTYIRYAQMNKPCPLVVADEGETRTPGETLDLDADGDGLAADNNSDFKVVRDDGDNTVVIPVEARLANH